MMRDPVRANIASLARYKPGKPIEEVKRELGLEGEIIKLASNENPLGPSPKAVAAMREQIENVYLYPDDWGFSLRRALSEKHGVDESQIVLGAGSCELIELTVQSFAGPLDEVISAQYAFAIFEKATQVVGAKNVIVPATPNLGHDLRAMADAVTGNTKVVFIANPNNPTGSISTAEEVEEFMNRMPEDVIVVFDEAYYEFVDREDYPESMNYLRNGMNVVIYRTFSKTYGLAGLRIGYAIAKLELATGMNQARKPFNTTRLGQIAALAALEDEEHLEKTLRVNRESREWLYRELEKLKMHYYPSEANFVLIDLKRDAQGIFERLLREGVVVRPLQGYDLPQCIRVSVGRREQMEVFIKALEKVLKQ
jgi:histidinol-phosphate aminotransferase